MQQIPVVVRLHDKMHEWPALKRIVADMIAAGLIGQPFICPDMVGGGDWVAFIPGSPFEQELFIRSAEVHALCPMMQISASPWRVLSSEHQRIFKDVVALRQKFAPRFVGLAKESARTGEPMMRNLEYCFHGMGYADIKDEFMMGQDLLVAPVLDKGAKHRRVVIPPGRWRGDDGKAVEGPTTIEVSTPLERLPHFIRMSGEVLCSRCSTEKRDSVKGAS
jgi:alpha-glucosidase